MVEKERGRRESMGGKERKGTVEGKKAALELTPGF